MSSAIAALTDLGQSPWYDNLTRALLVDGGLRRLLVDDGIRGVTSNPTIFEKAISGGAGYDEALRSLRERAVDPEPGYWELVCADITQAADLLAGVHDATSGTDGFVSVEVSPHLAHDTAATVAAATELWTRLGRRNVMIKIPATEAGLPAITATVAAGINVNVTLVFALSRYEAVIDAYLTGLEQRIAAGESVAGVHSVASFFVSRLDTEADRRLPEGSPLRGRTAVASARLAYQVFKQRFSGARWDALVSRGANLQRPLWASTSTKNPAYPPLLYVETLIGPHTVNTLAPPSVEVLHAQPVRWRPDTVEEDLDGAHAVMADLAAAGVDLDDVTTTLERDGLDAFARSYDAAIGAIERRLAFVGGQAAGRPA